MSELIGYAFMYARPGKVETILSVVTWPTKAEAEAVMREFMRNHGDYTSFVIEVHR